MKEKDDMMTHAKLLILLGMWLLPMLGFSQLSIGLMAGAANYQGDLTQNFSNSKEIHAVFGGGIGYRLSPYFDFKAQILTTTLSGDDANYPKRASRAYRFDTKITEYAAMLEYYVFGSVERTNTGIFEPGFTPFLYAGLGASRIKNSAECYSAECKSTPSLNPFPEKNFNPSVFTLPFGVGVKYDASPAMALGLRVGYRYSFSDYLDGISEAGNSKKNDWYYVVAANAIFYINFNKKHM